MVATVLAIVVVIVSPRAAYATVNIGIATLSDPANYPAPLPSGSAATLFTVSVPERAACTGDTPNSGYHVYSFLVQKGTEISTLTFLEEPSAGYGLITSGGHYFGPQNTAVGTGQVVAIPTDFQWSQLTASTGGALPLSALLYSGTSGVWETGLACADANGHMSDYWVSEVTFTASNSDPSGFTWAAVPGIPTDAPEAPLPILLPIVGVVVTGGVFALRRRRNGDVAMAVNSPPDAMGERFARKRDVGLNSEASEGFAESRSVVWADGVDRVAVGDRSHEDVG